ncbi:MAG TPA: site-specific integrase [Gammaproteobacteria bacterium]
MAYLVQHHGTFWFQIRVPRPLSAHYGQLVRQNLQTNNHAIAQAMAFQLAGHWLTRFATERMTHEEGITLPGVATAIGPEYADTQQIPVTRQQSCTAVCTSPVSVAYSRNVIPDASRPGEKPADSIEGILNYWRELNPGVRESTYKEFKTAAKEFRRAVHKRPADLQRSDIAIYRDKLIGAGLARATVGKKVGFISTLLQTAFDAGQISHNAARGMRIPKPKVAEEKRRAFTADELQRVFTSPVYARGLRPRAAGGAAAVWVPLIALATGARLEEVCQLRVTDLYVDDEYGPMMRINDSEEGQKLKTTGSRRVVPLHPDLVRAGLTKYWQEMQEAAQEWLFPELEPDHDNRRGGNWGKWFARYLRSRKGCGIADRQVVFHSLRHTFKTLCREAGIPEEVHDALTGHVGQTVGRAYGHVPLSTLRRALDRVQFPIAFPPASAICAWCDE